MLNGGGTYVSRTTFTINPKNVLILAVL